MNLKLHLFSSLLLCSLFTLCIFSSSCVYQQQPVYHAPRVTRVAPVTPVASTNRATYDLKCPTIKSAPYVLKGMRYTPMRPAEALHHKESGICSHYNAGGKNALGEKAPSNLVTAAHKFLPLPCVIKVTNLENGKVVYARVNDRGPFVANRALDISKNGAVALGFYKQGITKVNIEVISVGDGKLKTFNQIR